MAASNIFRQTLRELLRDACAACADVPPRYREVERYERVETPVGYQLSGQVFEQPDALYIAVAVEKVIVADQRFSSLVSAIRSDPELSAALLTGSFGTPDATDDNAASLVQQRFLTSFLVRYFLQLLFPVFSEGVYDSLITEVEAHLRSPEVEVRELCPLMNVRLATDDIELGPGLKIRKLPWEEIQRWVSPATRLHEVQSPIDRGDFYRLDCAIEHTYRRGRFDLAYHTGVWPEEVMNILRILTDCQVAIVFTEKTADWRDVPQRSWSNMNVRLSGPTFILDAEQAGRTQTLWRQWSSRLPHPDVDLALRRLAGAADRMTVEDRFIDYWVALEALFSPGRDMEFRFRIALRAATLIDNAADTREQVFKHLRDSYDLRSKIVHGGGTPSKAKDREDQSEALAKLVPKTREYLVESLLTILADPQRFNSGSLDLRLLRALPSRASAPPPQDPA